MYCGKTFVTHNKRRKLCSHTCSNLYLKRKMWNKERVLNEITIMKNQGLPLNAIYCRDFRLDLFKAAYRSFGSWNEALEKAGIDSSRIRLDRKTSSYKGIMLENVVEKLFTLSNISFIRKPYIKGCQPDFYDITNKIYIEVKLRSWTIGIEKSINKYLKHIDKLQIIYLDGGKRKYPDKRVSFLSIYEKFPIIESLRSNDKIIKELNKLKKQDYQVKRFKVWSQIWTKKAIICKIQSLIKSGKPINVAYLLKNQRRLYGAITKKRLFHNWAEAVSAAGFDPEKYSLKPLYKKWSKRRITQELKILDRNQMPLNMWSIKKHNSSLAKAIQSRRYYENLEAALADARINPFLHVKKWSKEKVIFKLQMLVKANEPINPKYLYKYHSSLYGAICNKRYFINWAEAVRCAGFDPYKVSVKKAIRFK